MNINLTPFLVVWALLAMTVLVMIAWRKSVSRGEEDSVHVLDTGASTHQIMLAHKLDSIDRWGKILTVITVVIGIVLAALWTYQSYLANSGIPSGA